MRELDLSDAGLVMEVPTNWKTPLKKGDTVVLLETDTVTGDNTVTGDPAEDGFWKVEPLTKDNKKAGPHLKEGYRCRPRAGSRDDELGERAHRERQGLG